MALVICGQKFIEYFCFIIIAWNLAPWRHVFQTVYVKCHTVRTDLNLRSANEYKIFFFFRETFYEFRIIKMPALKLEIFHFFI